MGDWKQKLSDSVGGVAVSEAPEKPEKPNKQQQWTLRYKFGNHPAETGIIEASSFEKAEEVGRMWCLKKGIGEMKGCRYISVSNPILADESILDG